MKEAKEPEIQLFGRKVLLPDDSGAADGGGSSGESSDDSNSGSGDGRGDCDGCLEANGGEEDGEKIDDEKQMPAEEGQVAQLCETKMQENDHNPDKAEESQNHTTSSNLDENPKTPSVDEATTSANNPKSENEQSDAANSAQKALKKPEKILPCPRCNSMDTKFCYYNNYNINQPRHFCRSCQRYWTAGGTMRNVPVGAGRRKSKNSASHCRHITISEALQAAQIDPPKGFHHHPGFKPNATVLSFGPDSPSCESMASGLNLTEKSSTVSCKTGENKEDTSIGSSVTTSSSLPKEGGDCPQQPMMPNVNRILYPVPCIPGVAWPFPWNPALPIQAICPPGYPTPFYPAPYWNCGVPNTWNVVPWISTPSPSSNGQATVSGPSSPLGKHLRNGELLKPNGSYGGECLDQKSSKSSSIVVPKTLRIDDPKEAAKSSIWETLGITYNSVSREGLFKALQPKGGEKKAVASASSVLQANPAAFSRSITFQESA